MLPLRESGKLQLLNIINPLVRIMPLLAKHLVVFRVFSSHRIEIDEAIRSVIQIQPVIPKS